MKRAYIKQVLALLLFSTNGIIASNIALSSYEIVFLRAALGSLLLVALFALSKRKMQLWKSGRQSIYIGISGMAMGISWILLYEAYVRIGVSIATLAYYCGPVFVVVLSPIVFKERITVGKIASLLLVVLGMALLNSNMLSQGIFSWGLLYGIMGAVLYAIMVISNKKAVGITGLENALYQLVFGFFAVAAYVLFKREATFFISTQDMLPILVLGIVNTGVGCYLYFSSIQHLPASTVAICGYLEPLSAVVLSVLLLKERLTWIQILGAALILGGAAFGDYARQIRKETPAQSCKQTCTQTCAQMCEETSAPACPPEN